MPRPSRLLLTLSFFSLISLSGAESDELGSADTLQVGVGKVEITPVEPIRLTGYGGRREPSQGVEGKLWAKALAIGEGNETVILIALDLIGIPLWLTEGIIERLGLPAAQVAICATHTHSSPQLRGVLEPIFMADIPAEHRGAIDRYSDQLVGKVVSACRLALNNRSPARIEWGQGEVDFAANRRLVENGRHVGFGVQPDGPVDHSLPIIKFSDPQGNLLAVLANYACHCTTLGGSFNSIHGDWAGEAQRLLEERHAGSTAMIAIGCGADANPNPRGTMEDVMQHAESLANEVDRLIGTELRSLSTVPETKREWIDLPLDPLPSREKWEALAASEDRAAYYAKVVLQRLDRGEPLPESIKYPVQTWTFADELAMVFLAGEVVVDYALKLKERFDPGRLWITAYANAAPSYIASRRLYDEGGYEVDGSMYYYDKPTRLSPDTEDLVLDEVLQQLPHAFYSDETLSRMPAPLSKEQALATMRVHADLEIELAAAEPLVMDPIDIAWGPDGRMWVVEMADYPLGVNDAGTAGGRVRVLEDRDGDGRYESSLLFMDGLRFPTSVFPWRDGVLIMTPPDLLFVQDTNGDRKADESTVLLTGFHLGNQQHLVNGMQWGLDGWLYMSDGDGEEGVHAPNSPERVRIDNRDLRFQPDSGEVEAILGRSQFGRNRDSWGRWFGNSNSRPGWHYALDDSYLKRNPFVNYAESKVMLAEDPVAPPVYPISRTLSRFNDYDAANHFTSISGFMVYEDDALGEEFVGNAFFAEAVHNVVSRAVLHPDGATFRSRRAPEEKNAEFLASTDNWFRPTAIRSGPDGALYIVDMYRFAIEHPQWIPEDWMRKLNLREGFDKGRIYRVFKKWSQRPQNEVPDLTKLSPAKLAQALDSRNRWQRDAVHQLIVWKPNPDEVSDPLRAVASDGSAPAARAHALWILSQLGALDENALLGALDDPHSAVREQAIHLCGAFVEEDPTIRQRIVDLAESPDERIQMQVAYTLGETPDKAAGGALAKMLLQNHDDPLMRSAILSSALRHQSQLVETAAARLAYPGFQPILRGLAQTAIGSGNEAALAVLANAILHPEDPSKRIEQFQAFTDLMEVCRDFGGGTEGLNKATEELVTSAQDLFSAARAQVADQDADPELRTAAMQLLIFDSANRKANLKAATALLHPTAPTSLQLEAVDAIEQIAREDSADLLLGYWPSYSPPTRTRVLATLLKTKAGTLRLLREARDDKSISKAFSALQVALLSRHDDPEVQELANNVLGQLVSTDRAQVVATFDSSLELVGDAKAGRGHFATLCIVCHRMGETGYDVGPDLASLTDKSPHPLLVAILDPNRAVEDKYSQYTATTQDGRIAVGVIAEETANDITLVTAGGIKQTVMRSNLASLQSDGRSLMPEGFESALDRQEMADLLAFVRSSENSVQIHPDDDGSVSLTATNGTAHGPSVFYDPRTESFQYIANTDTLEWTVHNLKAGQYDIFTEAGLATEYSGRPFTLSVNDRFVTGAVVYSQGMDRFRQRKFGNIEIEEDLAKAVFKLQHKLNGPQLGLRELRLIPIP